MQITHSCKIGFHNDCKFHKSCECDCHLRCYECNKFDINNGPVFGNNKEFLYRLCQSCYNQTMQCFRCNQYVGIVDSIEPYYIKDEEGKKYRLCTNCFGKWENYERKNA